eukprot:703708-Amphidinium_carterae.1
MMMMMMTMTMTMTMTTTMMKLGWCGTLLQQLFSQLGKTFVHPLRQPVFHAGKTLGNLLFQPGYGLALLLNTSDLVDKASLL